VRENTQELNLLQEVCRLATVRLEPMAQKVERELSLRSWIVAASLVGCCTFAILGFVWGSTESAQAAICAAVVYALTFIGR